jgi:DNA-binding winged helix-turn-helix (wHTH) protein/tetratricopeptide (TPR) repeat protein
MPPVVGFAFGPYELDLRAKRLMRGAAPVVLTPRQFELLRTLVQHAGQVVTKQALLDSAWGSIAVGENSLERMVSDLRTLLDASDRRAFIDTVTRHGYQFVAPITPVEGKDDGIDVEALLAPHRAWVDGLAALETLERDQIIRARSTFEALTTAHPAHAAFHIGLANAAALEFDSTRADPTPLVDALRLAEHHAHLACRLDAESGEAWATLGFVLQRTGDLSGALAALQRAAMLDPENWRHRFRLTAASWGAERLRHARETRRRCPDLPMAHWFAATVWVARHDLEQARRHLRDAVRALEAESAAPTRFAAVAVHYLDGLLCVARGDLSAAQSAFDAELAFEARGQLYARDCCANTWSAMGVVSLRTNDLYAAGDDFHEALARLPKHPMAQAGLALVSRRRGEPPALDTPANGSLLFESVLARAALRRDAGDVAGAVQLVADALRTAPPGNAGWLIPVEPLLHVWDDPDAWSPVLTLLHARAR